MEKTLKKLSLPQRISKDVVKHKWVYIMIIPVVVYFIMFKYMPMGWLAMSFYDFKLLKGFSGSKFVGLKHFIKFLLLLPLVHCFGTRLFSIFGQFSSNLLHLLF